MENIEQDRSISINVRHTHDGTMLYFHIPAPLKAGFIQGIQQGSLELAPGSSLELSVLPEFVPDKDDRQAFQDSGMFLHLNIPVDKIVL